MRYEKDFHHLQQAPGDFGPKKAAKIIPLIRTAKMVTQTGEYPCVLRSVRGDTLNVDIFSAPAPEQGLPFLLEMGDGYRCEVKLLWAANGHVGLTLIDRKELVSLLGSAGRLPKRTIRIGVNLPTVVSVQDNLAPAVIKDVSHRGAKIECYSLMGTGQQMRIFFPEIGQVIATIRWKRPPFYGIAFAEPFGFERIADIAVWLHYLSQSSRNPQLQFWSVWPVA